MNYKSNRYQLLIFLVSPVISFIKALREPRDNSSFNVIWFFCGFLGLTFITPTIEQQVLSSSTSDVARYLEEFNFWKSPDKDLIFLINNSYTVKGYRDIFFPFISLFFAKLGVSGTVFLGILGLFFGYFYSRVYKLVLQEITFKKRYFLIILLAAFLLINPMWRGINGFRFSFAVIVFIYLILKSYKSGFNFKTTALITSLFLVHFSFFLPIVTFFLFLALHKKLSIKVLFIIYIISFFLSEINLDIIRDTLNNNLPDFLQSTVESYTNETYIEELSRGGSKLNWYAQLYPKALFYSCALMLICIFFRIKYLKAYNPKLETLIKIAFFFSILVNITNYLPSLGRMELISNMFVCYIFIILFANFKVNIIPGYLKFFLVPMLLLYIVVQMRVGFDFMSTETIIGNPVLAMFNLKKNALIELLK